MLRFRSPEPAVSPDTAQDTACQTSATYCHNLHGGLASNKLYCLLTEAHACEQLAQGCYLAVHQAGVEPATL